MIDKVLKGINSILHIFDIDIKNFDYESESKTEEILKLLSTTNTGTTKKN